MIRGRVPAAINRPFASVIIIYSAVSLKSKKMLQRTIDTKWVADAKKILHKNIIVILVKTSCLIVIGTVLNALKVSLSRSVKNNMVDSMLITTGNKNWIPEPMELIYNSS